jgi:gas vesicle protein
VTNQYRICAGATLGALIGAAAAYLFYTDEGRQVRDRIEPAIDEAMAEFGKFRGVIEKVGAMAADGIHALEQFQQARAEQAFPGSGLAH